MNQTRALTGFILLLLAACSGAPPYRTALQAQPGFDCGPVYQDGRIDDDLKAKGAAASCWLSSWEKHPAYDLFSVEFDDQGWLADEIKFPGASSDQLANLMQGLESLSAAGGNPQPLSIVIYTHGWHHSAQADDDNVAAFRTLLRSTDTVERDMCLSKRHITGTAPAGVCVDGEKAEAWKMKRRVVGVYVGWRGDSVEGWGLDETSIWDRKLAAEKVSHGSIIEFYDRMHAFYRQHACHAGADRSAAAVRDCADVRMLTIGHSFGGLITYRALAPTLISNIVETAGQGGGTADIPYAYSFGELTVLINPAFEGTRFESLARAAAARDYQPGQESGARATAQLPMLLVVQSKGDDATGDLFPLFRSVTTLFESTNGPENQANIHTVGWSSRYQTHTLHLDPAGVLCDQTQDRNCLQEKLLGEAQWYQTQRRDWLRPFNAQHLVMSDGLVLDKLPAETGPYALDRPNFLPVWVVLADTTVIKDHDDFLNVHLVDFVRQVYSSILSEEDRKVEAQVRGGGGAKAAKE
jgi:hypothetical protein